MPRRYYPPRGEVYQKYVPPEFKPKPVSSGPFRRDAGVVYMSRDDGGVNTFKTESSRYTGTLVKGIATMHKSNAVPVLDQQQMIEISQMRRS